MVVTDPRLSRFFPVSCVTKLVRVTLGTSVRRSWQVAPPPCKEKGVVLPVPPSSATVYCYYFYCSLLTPPQPRDRCRFPLLRMADVPPLTLQIPIISAILDPIFSYVSSCLPPPVYNALLTLFAHALALFSALIGLGSALISSKPSDWDAQKIIPPLITLFAAYLALASALRTATWFVRTTAWLVKWGIIAAAVSAAATWLFGLSANGGGGVGGIVPGLAATVLDMLYGPEPDHRDATPGTGGGGSSRQRPVRPRPQAWDSFDEHWEWQFEEQQWNADNPVSPAAHVQQFVADALDRAREGGSWMSIARTALQSFSAQEQTREGGGESREEQGAQSR
jgi:hypothetical protein